MNRALLALVAFFVVGSTLAQSSEPATIRITTWNLVSTKKEEKLDDLLAPYLPAAVRAWIQGLKATKVAWNQSAHSFEDTGFPDHKVRSDCAQKIVEYLVGKAIERSMEISGSYKELSEVLSDLEKSPEAKRLLPAEVFEFTQSLLCRDGVSHGRGRS